MKFVPRFLTARSMSGARRDQSAPAFWILSAYLACVFLIGGGSRSDISSLVFLRPLAVLACALGLVQLDQAMLRRWRPLLLLAGAIFLLPLLHLIPLPASVWQLLPGRGLTTEIGQTVGVTDIARPLSLSPLTTWNALFSLFVPAAVLLVGIGLTDQDRQRLLTIVLLIGVVSAGMGALQAINPGSTALHFYRIDSPNASDGLFVNRNHQALFIACLIPMLAVFVATSERSSVQRFAVMTVGLIVLIPLLLVTGSRAGLIVGVLAIASLPGLMPPPNRRRHTPADWRAMLLDRRMLIGGVVVLFGGIAALSTRAEAFQRLFASSPVEEMRLRFWQPALQAAFDFLPFGSGIGSFVEIFKVYEPHDLLSPTYRNHAHNEFLELALTGGLPALLLLAVAVVGWTRLTWRWMRRPSRSPEVLYGRLGAVVIALIAIASTVDYPARVPSLACILTLAGIWLYGSVGREDPASAPTGSPETA